jgi:hypothetical protein
MKLLERSIVKSLDNFIDDRLNKANGVNKPYRAIKSTEPYKQFQSNFTEAIAKQGTWAVDKLPDLLSSAGIEDDLQPLGLEQQQKLQGLIERDMPALSMYITEHVVFLGLKDFFEWSAKQQYKRWGYIVKSKVEFKLSNVEYINALKDRSSYLLNQSTLDSTTVDDIIATVSESKLAGMTNGEVAQVLKDKFDDVSGSRGEMIARTESANAIGDANHATAVENGATTHMWVTAGDNPDDTCQENEDDGEIPIDQEFSSGDLSEPAHPNCECYTEAGEIDLDSIELWTGE